MGYPEEHDEGSMRQILDELHALPIPPCTLEIKGISTTDAKEYLRQFMPPRIKGDEDSVVLCICGAQLYGGGIMGAAFMSTFTWGLINGEGLCRECKYPTRMYHRFPEGSFTFPLQYHPDGLSMDPTPGKDD